MDQRKPSFQSVTTHYPLSGLTDMWLVKAEKDRSLWHIRCRQGDYALKYYGAAMLPRIDSTLRVNAAFSHAGIKCCLPLPNLTGSFISHVNTETLLVLYPWMPGLILSPPILEKTHIRAFAQVLGKLHSAKIRGEHIADYRWQTASHSDWMQKLREAGVVVDPQQLRQWQQWALQGMRNISPERIISHGDLTLPNMLWQDKDFYLIDWDESGWIHPDVELWAGIVNWCGFTQGRIHQNYLATLLDVYAAYRQPCIDETVIMAGFSSWLAWIQHNIGSCFDSQANQEAARKEIDLSIRTLQYIEKNITIVGKFFR